MSDRVLPIIEQQQSARVQVPAQSGRSCGPCTMCCTVMEVKEIGKARDERCEHLRRTTKPCSIYEDRPSSCRAYQCMWLMGAIDVQLRPDKVRAVMGMNDQGNIVQIMIHPSDRGAEKKGILAKWIAGARKKTHLIIMCGESRLLLRPPLSSFTVTDPVTGEEIK